MDISRLDNNPNLLIKKNINASKLSYFGSGGKLCTVIFPRSAVQLIWTIDQLKGQKYYIIGRGSNTLISDRGSEDAVIHTGRLSKITVDRTSIYAEAGAGIKAVSISARNAGLNGMEKLSGIPGTIGGAVYMNAGAYGSDMGSLVEYADVLIGDRIERIAAKDLGFSYRRSSLIDNGGVVLGVSLSLIKSNYNDIIKEEERYRTLRLNSQPRERSLGSVFKAYNGIPAAKYIEELKVKGLRIGGAEISRVHCNFIINRENATTGDYIALARLVQDKVRERYGILLQTELTYIGEADEDFRRLSYAYDLQPR